MEEDVRSAAERTRARIERGLHDPAVFRADLLEVAPASRDAWLDVVLGLGELPDDGADLPRGCVPYLPCPVDALLRVAEQASVGPSDVFVDIGSGVGRAAAFIHLLTGAGAIGLEIQRELAVASRCLSARLQASRLATIQGDASVLAGRIASATVFFLYCPFSGDRLAETLAGLEAVARTRPLRICSRDLPLPARPWLVPQPALQGDLAIYRTTLHDSYRGL